MGMKNLLTFYIEYGKIILFTIGLAILVGLSYYFSRYIPVELFEEHISPCMHGCMLLVAAFGAIALRRHIDGIYARQMWQMALIAWAVMEAIMLFAEEFAAAPTLIGGVRTIDRVDFVVRDVMAVILLAYPMEVLCPRWINWWRGTLLVLPSILISGLDMLLQEDMRSLQIVYPLLIAGWLWSKIREHRAQLEEYYSSLENTAMPWVRVYLSILTIIGLSYFYLSFTYHPTRLFTQQWLILLLLTYNTAQIILRRKPWQEELEETEETKEEDEEEKEEDAHKREVRERLEAWMETEKPYLNPEFRLVDLMHVLPMNRSYLSKFINVEYGCNFYQYVTNYRIAEAKRLMRECPDMKLQDVAEHSGFSSATIFTRVFSREEGITPSQWMVDNS